MKLKILSIDIIENKIGTLIRAKSFDLLPIKSIHFYSYERIQLADKTEGCFLFCLALKSVS